MHRLNISFILYKIKNRFFTTYSGKILLIGSVAWGILQMGRFALPPFLPIIIDDLKLTLFEAGLVLTALQVGYAITQYPSGRFSDNLTRSTLILPGLLILSISFFLIAIAPSYFILLFATTLLGIGKGLYSVPIRALISDLFSEKRGKALGVLSSGTDWGGIIASGISIVLIGMGRWRILFFFIGLILIFLTFLYVHWNRENYIVEKTKLKSTETIFRLFTSPQREILIVYTLFYFMTQGIINFLPTYLIQAKGISSTLASISFATLFLFGLFTKPAAGILSDRYSLYSISIFGLSLAFISLTGLIFTQSVLNIFIFIAIFSIGYKAQFPISDAIIMKVSSQKNMGNDLGAARAIFLGIGGLGPTYVGITAQIYDYTVSFIGLLLCLLLCIGIFFYSFLSNR